MVLMAISLAYSTNRHSSFAIAIGGTACSAARRECAEWYAASRATSASSRSTATCLGIFPPLAYRLTYEREIPVNRANRD
jgi:hypothetical protein